MATEYMIRCLKHDTPGVADMSWPDCARAWQIPTLFAVLHNRHRILDLEAICSDFVMHVDIMGSPSTFLIDHKFCLLGVQSEYGESVRDPMTTHGQP